MEFIAEIEVIREKYYLRADEEMIFLRLKGYEAGEAGGRGSNEDEDLRPRPRRCAYSQEVQDREDGEV